MGYSYYFGGYRSLSWFIKRRSLFWSPKEKAMLWITISIATILSFMSFSNLALGAIVFYPVMIGFIILLSYSFSSILNVLDNRRDDE